MGVEKPRGTSIVGDPRFRDASSACRSCAVRAFHFAMLPILLSAAFESRWLEIRCTHRLFNINRFLTEWAATLDSSRSWNSRPHPAFAQNIDDLLRKLGGVGVLIASTLVGILILMPLTGGVRAQVRVKYLNQ